MFDVTRLAIPHLKQSAAGVIINLTSIAGRFGFVNRSPYAATKWGVIGLTKTLAMELGAFGIRANAIAPGAVEGDRIERVFAGRAQISGRSLDDVSADAMAAHRSRRWSIRTTSRSLRFSSRRTRRSRSRGRSSRSTTTGRRREGSLARSESLIARYE